MSKQTIEDLPWLDQPELGDTIKRIRKQKAWNQGDVAEVAMQHAGWTGRLKRQSIQTAMSVLESGDSNGVRAKTSKYLEFIEKALGTSLRRDPGSESVAQYEPEPAEPQTVVNDTAVDYRVYDAVSRAVRAVTETGLKVARVDVEGGKIVIFTE